MVTTGVDISTLRFTSENNVVAAVPILILAISPIVSFSESLSCHLPYVMMHPDYLAGH